MNRDPMDEGGASSINLDLETNKLGLTPVSYHYHKLLKDQTFLLGKQIKDDGWGLMYFGNHTINKKEGEMMNTYRNVIRI